MCFCKKEEEDVAVMYAEVEVVAIVLIVEIVGYEEKEVTMLAY